MRTIAIIGFGGAGYSAALAARQTDPNAAIDVYTDTAYGPHNPMLTTYYIKKSIDFETMFPFGTAEDLEKRLKLHVFTQTPVVKVDPEHMLVCTEKAHTHYDSILISTGASAFIPPTPGSDSPGVFTMRTEEDAVYLRRMLDEGRVRKGLVSGASWSGIKVIEDFVSRGVPCVLMNRSGQAFSKALFPQTAARVQRDLAKMGIELAFGRKLLSIEREEDGRLCAVTDTGERYTADVMAMTSGVRPNLSLIGGTSIAVGKGILVNDRMQTNFPNIYSAGDCCDAMDIQSGKLANIGLWKNSMDQGRVAGINMAGGEAFFGANLPVSLAHYLGYNFLSIGDAKACTDEDEVYEFEDDAYYIRAVRNGRTLKCVNLIGDVECSGMIKNAFIKSIESPEAELGLQTGCLMRKQGLPESFIRFLDGKAAGDL